MDAFSQLRQLAIKVLELGPASACGLQYPDGETEYSRPSMLWLSPRRERVRFLKDAAYPPVSEDPFYDYGLRI